jgi:hypothetical protein
VRKEVVSQTYSDWCRWKGGGAINLKSNRERFQKSHIIHERIHATCREASNV